MSKFNKKATTPVQETVLSHEGGATYKATPYQDLCDRVLSSFFGEDRAYESGKQSGDSIVRLVHQVGKEDPIFVAKLAVLAREKFNLRSVSQVVVSELSKIYRGDPRMKKAIRRVIKRPDDMTEILSYIISSSKTTKLPNGLTRNVNKAIPNSIKKGVADAMLSFDAYQLSKYNSSKKELTLTDVIKLVHPKPKDEAQSVLFRQVMDGTLAKADTWERKISATGQGVKSKTEVETAKKDNWEKLIIEKKLGYMAMLRNIRNFIESKISKIAMEQVIAFLTNEKAVANSKQLPFRFYSAYKALQESKNLDPFTVKKYLEALETAMLHSVKNMTKIPGRTLVAVDTSGSMTFHPVSGESNVYPADIASVLGSIIKEMCDDAIISSFATNFGVVNLTGNSILSNAKQIRNSRGGGTNAHLIFDYLSDGDIQVDNVIILSDMQVATKFRDSFTRYKRAYPNVVTYDWNLNGYGNTLNNVLSNGVVQLSGWNESMIKYVTEYQELKNGIIDMVNSVEL